MRRIPLRRPSPALVISCIALTAALAGTSYATVLNVPKNSVGTAQLKSSAVTNAKIANGAVITAKLAANAVTSAKVLNGTLVAGDFKGGSLPAGPQGPAGSPGISGLQRFDITSASSSTSPKTAIATCPSGKRPVGGGARVIGNGAGVVSIIENFPDSDSVHWNAKASEVVATAQTWQLQAYALCAVTS
jgi:hypothetical protein